MVVVGGVSNQMNTISDLWILDVDSTKWKQVRIRPASLRERRREEGYKHPVQVRV